MERCTYEGSEWTIGFVIQHQLIISEIARYAGTFYFPLPKELKNPMKGLNNIQNEDNQCFRWCLVKYLNPINKNRPKFRNLDKELAKQLNC